MRFDGGKYRNIRVDLESRLGMLASILFEIYVLSHEGGTFCPTIFRSTVPAFCGTSVRHPSHDCDSRLAEERLDRARITTIVSSYDVYRLVSVGNIGILDS